jgi:hypothetical protein
MSLYEVFCRNQTPTHVHTEDPTPREPITLISSPPGQSPLLSLPPELRSQIYEYIIDSRIVHIRMNWAGIFSPTGYTYSCFNDLQPLLDSSADGPSSKAVPFDTDVTTLRRVCRQMHADTSLLPFKLWVWAFEDAFTLDQFVTARSLGSIPVHHKEAIRKVAVAPPGHHRSHEKVLQGLQEVLLISPVRPDEDNDQPESTASASRRDVIRLRRDTLTDTWLRSE